MEAQSVSTFGAVVREPPVVQYCQGAADTRLGSQPSSTKVASRSFHKKLF